MSDLTIGVGGSVLPKPLYLEAARRMGADPERCTAVEDSANGIRAALAAGMRTIALPNVHFPPPDDVLAQAHAVIGNLEELTPATIDGCGET